jgi:hypothetical protein
MNHLQKKFILEQLENNCNTTFNEQKIKEFILIILHKIAKKKCNGDFKMNIVSCLFTNFFHLLSSTKEKEDGLYDLSKTMDNWITNIEKVSINSNEGYIYIANLFSTSIQMIVKVAQKSKGFDSKIREYFIGIKAINNIRTIIPTFVHTFGAFLGNKPSNLGKITNIQKSKKTPYLLYEKIQGESIDTMLKMDCLTFKEWLLLFIQLLLGLDVSQREYRFTHFDLHVSNVIASTDVCDYIVHIDCKTYTITKPSMIPVIIDFGASSCYIDNRYIGTDDYSSYGMLSFMVPGYDMYKFMVYSAKKAVNPDVKKEIISLFRFYETNDPYNIFNKKNKGIENAISYYCSEITFCQSATYTPLMLIEWLMIEYKEIVQTMITISERSKVNDIVQPIIPKKYEEIVLLFNDKKSEALDVINSYMHSQPSYILNTYNIVLLSNYNKQIKEKEITLQLKKWNSYLTKKKKSFILSDKRMLHTFFDIFIPQQDELDNIVKKVLAIPIRHSDHMYKQNTVKELNRILLYHEQVQLYLDIYFNVIELGLSEIYNDWIVPFKQSNIYLFYNKNVTQNQRAIRWGQTLLASII